MSLLRQSKVTYFQNLSSRGQKEFWKAVKLLNKQDSSIPTLIDSAGVSIVSSSEKASLLNFCFFPHTISLWNSLSNGTVDSSSLASLKNLLSS